MKKICCILFLAPFIISIAGCLPLIIGGAVGALGGYAVSKDAIQGNTDKDYDLLWNSALNVSKARGTIKQEDYTRGYIELEVKPSHVWIRLARLTPVTTRLRVSARKYRLPHIDLAQDMYVKIMELAK